MLCRQCRQRAGDRSEVVNDVDMGTHHLLRYALGGETPRIIGKADLTLFRDGRDRQTDTGQIGIR